MKGEKKSKDIKGPEQMKERYPVRSEADSTGKLKTDWPYTAIYLQPNE